YRFELGKLAKHSSGMFGLASPQIESSVVSCRRISEVCPNAWSEPNNHAKDVANGNNLSQ
ncbi:hypothetical protein PIB30_102488, partial [Stylosanthes scabra]|nr:hypothetical protein [Stylosanthes scabra]